MSTYKSFANSEKHEKDGVWLDLGEAGRFKLARAGGANSQFKKLLSKRLRPYRRQLQTDTADEAAMERVLIETFARTVILGWEGVTDREEKPLPYSYENCVTLLTELPDLFREIHEAATEAALYREHIAEEDAKNS